MNENGQSFEANSSNYGIIPDSSQFEGSQYLCDVSQNNYEVQSHQVYPLQTTSQSQLQEISQVQYGQYANIPQQQITQQLSHQLSKQNIIPPVITQPVSNYRYPGNANTNGQSELPNGQHFCQSDTQQLHQPQYCSNHNLDSNAPIVDSHSFMQSKMLLPVYQHVVDHNNNANTLGTQLQYQTLSQNPRQHIQQTGKGNIGNNRVNSSQTPQILQGPTKQLPPKSWHKQLDDAQNRKIMIDEIVKLLQQRRPQATADWLKKLPQMAARLEEALYYEADSNEQYRDLSTLKSRLQGLALSMGGKNPPAPRPSQLNFQHSQHNNQTHQSTQGISQQQFQQNSRLMNSPAIPQISTQLPMHNHQQMLPNQIITNQQSQFLPNHSTSQSVHLLNNPPRQQQNHYPSQHGAVLVPTSHTVYNNGSVGAVVTDTGSNFDSTHLANALTTNSSLSNQSQQRQFVNLSQINPMFGPQSNQQVPQGGINSIPPMSIDPSIYNSNSNTSTGDGKISNPLEKERTGGGFHSEEHRKQVLKQQQQRLLLLRHASKCPHEGNQCTVTPHCASMKELWKHIMNCKEQDCKIPHCVSSRYVLSHYSKCREPTCPVCGPVRDAIRKNVNRNQQILNMSNGQIVATPGSNDIIPSKPPPSKGDLDPVSCAIYSFPDEQILSHIALLQEGLVIKSPEIKEICGPLIEEILRHNNGYVFASPVDPVALRIPDYLTIVKKPIDLGTIKKRLDTGYYRDINECAGDVKLCFDNAMLYNPRTCEVHQVAKYFKKQFEQQLKVKLDKLDQELRERKLNPECCSLCGQATLKFEPPVYYCNGKCGSQRIRRNSIYFHSVNNSYHWCSPCYNELHDTIKVAEGVIYKKDLVKKKHADEPEEPWVQCDSCNRWVHQICTLFNGRRNISEEMPFVCPNCIIERRKKSGNQNIASDKKTQAKDLPHTIMTEFIEQRVRDRLNIAYAEMSEKLGIPLEEMEKCPPICIRQVSSVDKVQVTREGMLDRYRHKNFPTEFPYRSKCIILFQSIDGQDVILFGMYVYEYGHKCPQPNQRRVYISYLDSVHYFRPRQYRTTVYQEIIVAYLEYVKARGFHTAHIWACPPLKGDDYILYCHPQDQKTPKDDRLRQWYVQILDTCVKRGIVLEVTDMYTEFLANPANDSTVIPYFEGDYWIGEAENIIKNLQEDGSCGDSDSDVSLDETGRPKNKRKSKNKAKTKTKRPRVSRGTVSGKTDRDPVMSKFANIIEPMKEAFFVARLLSKEYALEKAATELCKEGNVVDARSEKSSTEQSLSAVNSEESLVHVDHKSALIVDSHRNKTTDRLDSKYDTIDQNVIENKEVLSCKSAFNSSQHAAESKCDELSDTEVKTETFKTSAANNKCDQLLRDTRDDTEDVDDTQDCEHFETRQALLNLCQGNHYQFDQLRRAKHTSLMVLYHLHNPDAPKFIASCSKCISDILSGYRFHCETCDIDICQRCHQLHGSKIHQHPLRPMVVSGGAPAVQLTDEQRKERQRNITVHLNLLLHATSCASKDCASKNCQKMKEFLKHGQTCQTGYKKNCPICVRVNNLLNIHARQCRIPECNVPKCKEIKENIRQNTLLQHQMDDRRRAQMNEIYSSRSHTSDDAKVKK